MKKPDRLSPDERTVLDTYGKSANFIDLPAADPLVAYMQGK